MSFLLISLKNVQKRAFLRKNVRWFNEICFTLQAQIYKTNFI